MSSLIKKSFSMINCNLKEILLFSIMVSGASFISTMFLPLGGIFLSTMISFYMIQVFILYSNDGRLNVSDLPEPNLGGILKSCGISILISIPIISIAALALTYTFGTLLKVSLIGLFNFEWTKTIMAMMYIVLIPIAIIAILSTFIMLICPFYAYVLLDEDFREVSAWGCIKISFKLSKGCRIKVFLAMIFNYCLVLLSIITLGISLVYTQPLYLILMCNIYNQSKIEKFKNINEDCFDVNTDDSFAQ